MTRFAPTDWEDRSLKYESRIVAFLDILGFADRVMASQENAENVADVYRILTRQNGGLKDEDFRLQFSVSAEITVFSDTILISEVVEKCFLPRFLQSVGRIQATFLEMGFPLRGGIAVGPLIHNPSVIMGPALIEAYELEKTVAVYPRVVLSKVLSSDCTSYVREGHASDGNYHVRLCQEQGEDFRWVEYGHYLSNQEKMHRKRREVRRHKNSLVYFGSIPEIDFCIEAMEVEIQKHQQNVRILSKMEWLYRHLLRSKAHLQEIEPMLRTHMSRNQAVQLYQSEHQIPHLLLTESSQVEPPPYAPLPKEILEKPSEAI